MSTSTSTSRHAAVEGVSSPQRRLLVQGGLAAAAAAVGGAALGAPSASAAVRPTLKPGSRGALVKSLQVKLRAKGYWHAGSDGVYGQTTQQAVMAVQKAYGLTRDGICGAKTWAVIDRLGRARARTTRGTVMEVDLKRQLILFVVSGKVKWVFNTSTGAAGWRTPPGRFTISRQINGMRHAPLGQLWRPKYFNGGIAIHGSPSIPGHPASHGCARLSNAAINYVWSAGLAPIGRRVWVY